MIGVPDKLDGERVEAVIALREELAEEEMIASPGAGETWRTTSVPTGSTL